MFADPFNPESPGAILNQERRSDDMSKLRFITLETLLEMKENKESFTLADALPEASYREGHIPGAINLPAGTIAKLAKNTLDKKTMIITYCGSYACHASTIAARKLLDLGYENVADFKGGKKAWQNAGLEFER